jgi:hypothetical protein
VRWDAVVYEYGVKHDLQRQLWAADPSAYYRHLLAAGYRSTAGRYSKLIDDIRDDTVRIGPFFAAARRVLDLDRRRRLTMDRLADIAPTERLNALARIGENSLTIAWVRNALVKRCAAYRFALDHLVTSEPEPIAAQADVALAQLQQLIAANPVVTVPQVAAAGSPAPFVK